MNRENAMALAILFEFQKFQGVEVRSLLENLCEFSYKGDMRMRWKMENPHKVRNIVDGQYDRLLELYSPVLREFADRELVRVQEEDSQGRVKRIEVVQTEKTLQELFD